MLDGRWYLMATNRIMYHIIMFVSLIAAIKLYPIFVKYAAIYIQQEYGQIVAAYLAVYLTAWLILPEVGALIYKMLTEE